MLNKLSINMNEQIILGSLNATINSQAAYPESPYLIYCRDDQIADALASIESDAIDLVPGAIFTDSSLRKIIYYSIVDSEENGMTRNMTNHEIGSNLVQYIRNFGFDTINCILGVNDDDILKIIEGCLLKYPTFEEYKTKKRHQKEKNVCFIVQDELYCDKALQIIKQVVDHVLYVRRLVNLSPNHLRPSDMAAEAYKLEQLQVNCKVLQGDDIKDMQCLTAVGQASADRAKLIVLEWLPRPTDKKVIGLVGKGITFDSGGLSIKTPSVHMEDMKADMAGAATVMGIVRAAASMKLDYNIVAVIPCAENMISGNSLRPGDVLSSYSGQTVEVLNTDAEGRLVLCDALWYIQTQTKYTPQIIIDFATLTGAIVTALGKIYMGLFSNNDELVKILIDAGQKTGEKVWRMPLDPKYDKLLDSKIADMKNISASSHGAGSITAAQFLYRFISKECMWAHIDFAGTAYTDSPSTFHEYGASGEGVRLILEALPKLSQLMH